MKRDGLGWRHPFCPPTPTHSRVHQALRQGLSQPFRFQLRPGGLAVGDVGWNTREEVDLLRFAEPGKSYGWPCYEGTIRTPAYEDTPECALEYAKPPGSHLGPVHDYPQNPDGAVHVGPVYTATAYPLQYRDKLYFGDYTDGSLHAAGLRRAAPAERGRAVRLGLGTVDLELAPNGKPRPRGDLRRPGRGDRVHARRPHAERGGRGQPEPRAGPPCLQFTGSGRATRADEP